MELRCFFALLMALLEGTFATKHVVYWDDDQIPRLSSGGLEITLEVDDWMDILCPYTENAEYMWRRRRNKLILQLYNVTRENYANCDTRRGIRLQTCDDPASEKKLTTKFQQRSPYPYGFTFRPGATYYYLSKPLNDLNVGCTQDTMRMMIHVRQRGTVFHPSPHERTLTYHTNQNNNPTDKDLTRDRKPGHVKKPPRHHHHDRTMSSTTRSPKVIIQFETPTSRTKQVRPSAVVQDDPGNAASTFNRPWMSSVLPCLITLYLSNFLTNFVDPQ